MSSGSTEFNTGGHVNATPGLGSKLGWPLVVVVATNWLQHGAFGFEMAYLVAVEASFACFSLSLHTHTRVKLTIGTLVARLAIAGTMELFMKFAQEVLLWNVGGSVIEPAGLP